MANKAEAEKLYALGKVKKATLVIIENLRNKILGDQGFMDRAKIRSNYFTRRRLLPFSLVMFMIIRLIRVSLQNEVENIFQWLHIPHIPPTGEALCKARNKIRWEACEELFHDSVEWRYSSEERLTWHGYRVSAIDGTKLALPIDRKGELLHKYGGMGVDSSSPTGQGSILFDIYNDLIIDAQLAPLNVPERDLAVRHIECLKKLKDFDKELIIFDRGYPSLDFMSYLDDEGITFVMRVKNGFNADIDRMKTGSDRVLIIPNPNKNMPGRLRVRVLKFDLPGGETETLITNLYDRRMGTDAFRKLYFKRWPVETEYDIVKNKLEIEHFSGVTDNAVRQEFFATMFIANYAACFAREAQEEADAQRAGTDNQYNYQININHEVGTLRTNFIDILVEQDPKRRAEKLQNVLDLITRAVEAERPKRSTPRGTPRAVKHHHNRKPNR